MPAATLDHDSALDAHLEQIVFTLALLLANPHTGALAPGFEQALDRWWEIDKQETLCWIDILKAAARIVAADNRLDTLVDRVDGALKMEENEGRATGLREVLFKGKPRSVVKRPVLSSQLEQMTIWPKTLNESGITPLQAMVPDIDAALDAAKLAKSGLDAAKQANQMFRAAGERRAFVEMLNGLRKQAWGTLAEMPHSHPELGLPASFPEQFFKRLRRKPAAEEGAPQTAEEIAMKIRELEAQIEDLKTKYADALVREEQLAKDRAQRDKDMTALEEAERDAEAALARAAALRAKLDA